jgi:hypothetical protein
MKSKLIGLVVCATLFGTATHVQASTIVGGNGLLSASGANQIETWLDNTSKALMQYHGRAFDEY